MHRLQQVPGLIAHAFQGRAGKFSRPRIPREPEHRAPAVRPPVGRAKAGEGGDHDHLLQRIRGLGQRLLLVGEEALPLAAAGSLSFA